jgi:hypothetical protein
MKAEDPIALLRALDPADEKDVEMVVAGLTEAGSLDRILAPAPRSARRSRPPRLALLAAIGVAAVVIPAVLVTDPFSRSGTISSAQAKAQAARALDLRGGWHVTRITQSSFEGRGSTSPHWSKPFSDDVWHAPDGRLVITSRGAEGDSSTWLYAGGQRRSYDTRSNSLTIHRFASPADLRDEMRTYLPPTAADLYQAAYRVGKVRLAGAQTIGGRRVYRLAFDWLGSSYTLVFDADRQVPISSESRIPNGAKRYFFTRVRYTAYERVAPGPRLDRRLALPPIPSTAKIVREEPLVIAIPIQGTSATRAMRAIVAHSLGGFPSTVALDRARWVAVRPLANGGVFAAAIVPAADENGNACYAYVEIARRGGAVRPITGGCPNGISFIPSKDGKTMLVGGFTQATGVELRFANGARVRATLHDGVVLAAPPIRLFRYALEIVRTYPNGVVKSEKQPVFHGLGGLPAWLTG